MLKNTCLAITLIIGCLSAWSYFLFSPTVTDKGGAIYYLRPGTSKQRLVSELTAQGILKHAYLFSAYIYPQAGTQLKSGEYLFPQGSSLVTIWRQVTHGKGLYYRRFTIVPGWSFAQLRNMLMENYYIKHTIQSIDNKAMMNQLGSPDLNPEGQFFPETYRYTRDVADMVILKHAFDLMQQQLKNAWASRQADLPYKNAYEALIAASLIEKEAYLDTERPIIAGVLINRLRSDMLLQIDPTVIYGLGERYTGKLHKENLLENTAYNTYVHKGLPPTPIAMPGPASLSAAVHPQTNDFYYFVAKGNGSHQFSKTLPEHTIAVHAMIERTKGS